MNVTKDLIHALQRDICPPPRYVFTTEVQVPYEGGLRFIDGVSIDLRSKPYELTSYEAKVSRRDWLSEARRPEKSKPGRDATDRFYYVFGSPHIYALHEVPPECGVIHVDEHGHAIQVRPSQRSPVMDTEHYARGLLIAFLNRFTANRQQQAGFLDRIQREERERGYRMGYNAAKRTEAMVNGKPRHSSHTNPDKTGSVKVDGDGLFCP